MTYVLEKTNILQKDSSSLKTWPDVRYELPDLPVQFEQIPFIKSKTQFSKAQNELPSSDGIPMETERHKLQMDLLINSLKPWLGDRGYVGGNMFVYFSPNQVKDEDFKGPDIFIVLDCSNHERKSWVVWEEKKSPNVVIELLSKTTAKKDKEKNKPIYQNKLKVQEYYWFDPHNPDEFKGFKLQNNIYQELPFKNESLESQQLGLKLVRWQGVYDRVDTVWLRWTTLTGELLLLPAEIEAERADVAEIKAIQEKQRTNAEAKRANAAEQRAQVAFSEGEQQGKQEKALETARKMLAKGFDLADIAELTDLSIDELVMLSKW